MIRSSICNSFQTSFDFFQLLTYYYFLQVCPYQEYLGTGISRRHHYFKKYLRIEQFKNYLRIYRKLVLETGGKSQIQDILIQLKVFIFHIWQLCIICFVRPIFPFRSLLATKLLMEIQKYYVTLLRWARQKKKSHNLNDQNTKIERWKYGMNET